MTDPKTTSTKWKNWLLIGSLALNLAIIGLLAGLWLRGPGDNRGKPPPQADLLRELVRAVPKDHRGELRRDLGSKQQEMRAFRTTMKNRRNELVQVLVDPQFDISQVVAIFDDHRLILSRITSGGHEIIIRRIEAMTAQERAVFAQNIQSIEAKRYKRK